MAEHGGTERRKLPQDHAIYARMDTIDGQLAEGKSCMDWIRQLQALLVAYFIF